MEFGRLIFFQLFVVFALVATALAEEQAAGDTKKDKRGIYGLGYGGGYSGYGGYAGYAGYNLPISHGVSVITKEVAVPVAQPVAVAVEKHVPVPVKVNISLSLATESWAIVYCPSTANRKYSETSNNFSVESLWQRKENVT